MNINLKVIAGLVALLIILGSFYYLNRQTQETQLEGPVSNQIKIGALVALTGEAASYGMASKNVLQLAADEINSQGGINGIPIKFIYEDSKCNARDGVKASQKLIFTDKVKIIVGASCSSENLASIPLINTNHVILFAPTATSPELTNKSPYFFRNHPSDDAQGNAMAEFVYNTKNWRTVAFLIEKVDYPLGVYQAFKTTFEQLGGQIVKEEFETNITDYRGMLSKLKSNNPDALFLDLNTPLSVERALKQLKDLNWNPPLILLDSFTSNTDAVQKLKNDLEGALSAESDVKALNPKFQHLQKAYKERYGTELPYPTYMQDVYDAVYILKDGISSVGYNSDKLAAWSRTLKDWEGASGKVTINQKGDRVGGHVIKIIKNGKTHDFNEN